MCFAFDSHSAPNGAELLSGRGYKHFLLGSKELEQQKRTFHAVALSFLHSCFGRECLQKISDEVVSVLEPD